MSAAVGPMNLLEILDRHKALFYFGYKQWWIGESFTRALPTEPLPPLPRKIIRRGAMPRGDASGYPRAVDLASLYVQSPQADIWKQGYRFVCADRDSEGRRVYLCYRDGKMEIHRWEEPDMSWGCAA